MKALGMIEVYGRVGAIEGLDSAVKAANVSLVNMVKVGGGLTTFFVEGDVGAVKASIDAAASAAEKVGQLLSKHVIPRPDPTVRKMIDMELNQKDESISGKNEDESKKNSNNSDKNEKAVGKTEEKTETKQATKADKKIGRADFEKNVEEYKHMTVSQLRTLARTFQDFPLTKQEIKFAKKEELIEALSKK